MMVQKITRRNYTEEELAYALDRLEVDPELDKKLSFPDSRITAGDFERHVAKLRRLKQQIGRGSKLSRYEVSRLIEEFPDLIGWQNFGVCDYTAQDEPLYHYSSSDIQDIPPTPVIHETKLQERSRSGSVGIVKLGDLLKK